MPKIASKQARAGSVVGMEYNHLGIRAARVELDGKGGFHIQKLEEALGDYAEDGNLTLGLREIKDRLGLGSKDSLVSCLGGKQVYAAQIPFRSLAHEEMESALRIEMRKSVPFEVAGSALDYHFLDEGGAEGETRQVLVAMSSESHLAQHLNTLEKAGMKPRSVDVLPVAVANAMWMWHQKARRDRPMVALHIGPQISTIVIDGARSPFFNRNIYFAAEEILSPAAPADSERRLQSLGDEIARSLAFYENSNASGGFDSLLLMGEYAETAMGDFLKRRIGLPVMRADLAGRGGFEPKAPPGRFDLVISMCLQEET
jgi:Tfp pilus assembly PilM family ATPase